MRKLVLTLLFLQVLTLQNVFSQIHLGPFLEKPTPNSYNIAVEGELGENPYILLTNSITNKSEILKLTKVTEHSSDSSQKFLYKANIKNYAIDTMYSYQILNKNYRSPLYTFKTDKLIESKFSFLAMSDAQNGPNVTTRNVLQSVIPLAMNNQGDYPIRFSLFAGDLVQYGSDYHRWKKEFFGPLGPIFSQIPVIPALGNHEQDHSLYFSYFDLPKNGTPGLLEHWYYFDYANIRFITLDTNRGYRTQLQLNWLSSVLTEAANDEKIDFVIAQFHHPHQSELWLDGETEFSGRIEERLVAFSKNSQKPSLYFCGHTHGYSRGHSFEANHTMLVIGSMGGSVDEWGRYRQRDYPHYVKTLDEFGWIRAYVDNTQKPQIKIERQSFGDNDHPRALGVVDSLVLKRYNQSPDTPHINNIMFKKQKLAINLSSFSDKDGDTHLTTHYQLSNDSEFKDSEDVYVQAMNIYKDEDLAKDTNLEALELKADDYRYLRVRYRDNALAYSQWSDMVDLKINKLANRNP